MPQVTDWVERRGEDLVTAERPFRVVGANCYSFGFSGAEEQGSVLDLAEEFGFNALRIWAFLDAEPNAAVAFQEFVPGADRPRIREGPDGLERLDRAVHLAGERGIRLILTLTNYHSDYGGMPQYQRWLGLPGLHDFYRDPGARAVFQQWIDALTMRANRMTGLRYADDPAILAWEIGNEPRCDPRPDGAELLVDWLGEMSRFIRHRAPRQLIAAGDEGFFCRQGAGSNWLFDGSCGVSSEKILGISDIDFGVYHLYPDQWLPSEDPVAWGQMWISEHAAAGRRARKPVILEEYGAPPSPARDSIYRGWLEHVEDCRTAGDLVWRIGGATEGDPYLLRAVADAPAVREHALRYQRAF